VFYRTILVAGRTMLVTPTRQLRARCGSHIECEHDPRRRIRVETMAGMKQQPQYAGQEQEWRACAIKGAPPQSGPAASLSIGTGGTAHLPRLARTLSIDFDH